MRKRDSSKGKRASAWLERILPGALIVWSSPAQLPAQGLQVGSTLSATLRPGWLLAILGVAVLLVLIRFFLHRRRDYREMPIPLIIDLEALSASAAAANAKQGSLQASPRNLPLSPLSPLPVEPVEPAPASSYSLPRETFYAAPPSTPPPSPLPWRSEGTASLHAIHASEPSNGTAQPTEQDHRVAAALNGSASRVVEAPVVPSLTAASGIMSSPMPEQARARSAAPVQRPHAPALPAAPPIAVSAMPSGSPGSPAARVTSPEERSNGNGFLPSPRMGGGAGGGGTSRAGGQTPRQPATDLPTIVLNAGTEQPLQLLPGTLEILEGAEGPTPIHFFRTAALELPEVTLGRAHGPAYRHINLRAPSVSRLHARMRFEAGHWTILNLSQTNPVRVNGLVLDAPEVACTLKDGDRIQLGEVVLRYREQRA